MEKLSVEDLSALVVRCQSADDPEREREAWVLLIGELRDRLWGYIFRFLGCNYEDSNDAFQIVCLSVFRKIRTLRDPANFRSWSKPIATRVCINFKRTQVETPKSPDDIEAVNDDENPIHAAPPSPDKAAEKADEAKIMKRAIDSLPARSRQLIEMKLKDFSHRKIAEQTGLTVGSVGVLMGKAYGELEEKYKKLSRNA